MRVSVSVVLLLALLPSFCYAQSTAKPKVAVYNQLGITSSPANAAVTMELYARFQHKVAATKSGNDTFDRSINSPKSVNYLSSKGKFYVQSLEGHETVVYDLATLKKIKVISHDFTDANQSLFKDGEYSAFDYKFQYRTSAFNIFKGKPVESTFSHDGKYLWVTYYRRSYDANAQNPSAVAIIDTDTDEIVRVMPSGALPKMIAASPDNRFIAVTHWGDNTVAIIDITSSNPFEFKYLYHLTVEKRLSLDYAPGEKIDRDAQCGYCLRGTVFTPDAKYLLVGRMGGGGVAVFDVENNFRYMGATFTQHNNIRHLVISGDYLLISTNANGYIQKIGWKDFIQHRIDNDGQNTTLTTGWQNCYVGPGVRTISVSSDGRYVFACVNEASKIVVVDAASMKVVSEIAADSYPVGMEITDGNDYLFVTAQGKSASGGGHSVMIYKIGYAGNPAAEITAPTTN